MGFTKFTKNVLNVSALPDRVQNQASSLKLVFDQAGVDIKAALNALISELEAKVAAANIGADVASVTEKNVQGILTAFENEIANRYTKAETNNAILADTNELIADVKIDLATGLLTVTKKNGTKQTFETSTEAESYAVGGTGTRPGEDTDNAKYYAQIAKQVAGGDFVTVVEMEGYAQKKGLYPNYNETELKGEVIETETTLEAESVLKVHGNSEQATRSGKNLFNQELVKTARITERLETGFKLTKGADATDANCMGEIYTVNLPAGEYKFLGKRNTDMTDGNGISFWFRYEDGTSAYPNASMLFAPSYTIPKNLKTIQPYFQTTTPAGQYWQVTDFMIVKSDTTDLSYERYGIMPSPDYLSPILSITSKSNNLFNKDTCADGQGIGASGALYPEASYSTSDFIEIKPNIKYSCANASWGHTYDSNKNPIAQIGAFWKPFTPPANAKYLRVSMPTKSKSLVQINEGAIASPPQPYGYVPAEARVEGRNLVKTVTSALNTSVVDGVCTQTTTNTNTDLTWKAHAYQNSTVGDSLLWQVKNGLGVKSFTFWKKSTFNRIRFGLNGTPTDNLVWVDVSHLEDGEYTFQWNVLNTTQGSISWNNIQINRGGTLQPYELGKFTIISLPLGDIELRSTPDGTRDTFARVDGVWNKKENITPFTIAENMVLSVNIDRYNVPYANVPKTYIGSGVAYAKNIALLASYDEIISTAEVGHGKFATNFSAEHVAIFNSGIADLATAKTILAGETGIIKRAEPTYTPITDPALISALDELEQLVLHKGYNRITVTGVNGVKAQLELEIAPTALLTNISETEAGLNMPVPVVSEAGDVLVKVPKADNQMTINPATGVVNVKALTINGVSLDAYIRSIIG